VGSAFFGEGLKLRLTGPGIETALDIAIGGVDAALWPLRAARCRYPAGFDLFLIDGSRVMGLPRSTQIEVL
jgi:alpha-D-ribose 1-methylphosphonate 5-triphosphate synthase subunit PhnH